MTNTTSQRNIRVRHPEMYLCGQPIVVDNIDTKSKGESSDIQRKVVVTRIASYRPLSVQRTNLTLQESGPHSNMLLGSHDEGE